MKTTNKHLYNLYKSFLTVAPREISSDGPKPTNHRLGNFAVADDSLTLEDESDMIHARH